MAITGDGLVAYVKSKIGVPYVYGTKMEILTLDKFNFLQKTYGKSYVWDSDISKVGQVCCDCSGLISSYTGVIQGSEQMKTTAKTCAPVSDLKNAPVGALLWQSGHVGVFIGYENGAAYYIAEDGSAYGCRKNKVANASFTHYLIMDYIHYEGEKAVDESTKQVVSTAKDAVAVLTQKGIMNTPDYWLNASTCVKYLDTLLINMANKI